MILGAALDLFLLITWTGQQQNQQPQFTNQSAQHQRGQQHQQQLNQQRFPNKQQQGQVLDHQKQQHQLLNQNQHQGQPIYNANQVIACLNHRLADSIVKAGITGALTLHNNTNGTVTETFIMNATNVWIAATYREGDIFLEEQS
ncbi:MAG: hypothetical protein WBE34_02135 [Candidatus Nitrosopolaris sp.]